MTQKDRPFAIFFFVTKMARGKYFLPQPGDRCSTLAESQPALQRFAREPMKLDATTFMRLRRLAPVLDDVLNAGEVEHPDQAVDLASLAQLCTQIFDAYGINRAELSRELTS